MGIIIFMPIEKTTGRVLDIIMSGDHQFMEVVDPLDFVLRLIPAGENGQPQLENLVSWLEEEVEGYVPNTRRAMLTMLLTETLGDDWDLYMSSDQPTRLIYRQADPNLFVD